MGVLLMGHEIGITYFLSVLLGVHLLPYESYARQGTTGSDS